VTIAVSLKVNEGVVLAADSASTLIAGISDGVAQVANVYYSANKIFNLRKGLPIGAITWGSGSIGPASISALAKDLRERLTGKDGSHSDWELNKTSYSVLEVAQRVRSFFYEELYVHAFAEVDVKPDLGFVVAGYSSGSSMADEYRVVISGGEAPEPEPVRDSGDTGVTWSGEPEAITRIVMGHGAEIGTVLKEQLGVPDDQVEPALGILRQHLAAPLVQPAMPFQDAIELAEFLVELTIGFKRFGPGAPTVGGPIEVAAITKHEGFKWVKRKHYYEATFNPEVTE
jgi:hypothetical protein